MVKPTTANKNTRERIMIKMKVYIVYFNGAYGMEIEKVFKKREDAEAYADKANQENWMYQFRVKKYSVE